MIKKGARLVLLGVKKAVIAAAAGTANGTNTEV